MEEKIQKELENMPKLYRDLKILRNWKDKKINKYISVEAFALQIYNKAQKEIFEETNLYQLKSTKELTQTEMSKLYEIFSEVAEKVGYEFEQ